MASQSLIYIALDTPLRLYNRPNERVVLQNAGAAPLRYSLDPHASVGGPGTEIPPQTGRVFEGEAIVWSSGSLVLMTTLGALD